MFSDFIPSTIGIKMGETKRPELRSERHINPSVCGPCFHPYSSKPYKAFFFGQIYEKHSEGYDIMRELQLVRDDNSLVMLLTVPVERFVEVFRVEVII